jgi:hypothetical protein
MNIKLLPKQLAALFCGLLFAGCLTAQEYVKKVDIQQEEASLQMDVGYADAFFMKITGPEDFEFTQEIRDARDITISSFTEEGKAYKDGIYTMQVTPIFDLTAEERVTLRGLLAQKDAEALAAFRLEHNLPANVHVYNMYFSIKDGKFLTPQVEPQPTNNNAFQWNSYNEGHKDYPSAFASMTQKHMYYGKPVNVSPNSLPVDNTPIAEDAQVFATDVIVQGSICVGFDCATSESFGFDTQRLKENNLRIHFNDTSASASFPSNDWRITINDTSNGGANYFAIEDATASRIPFLIEAGAFANTLYVDSNKKVGINTSTPAVEVHARGGNTPGLRLDQDGSAGFQSQVWDVAANETNFFIRDVSNGSRLPFRIRPQAPENSIYVWSNGNVGLGVGNGGPSEKLQIESGNVYVKSGSIGVNVVPTQAMDILGNFKVTGTSFFTGDMTSILGANGASFFNSSFSTVLRLDATNARVGIGVQVPAYQLQLSTDEAYKPSGGDWLAASDRRLKKDIKDFSDGLEVLMGIRPVSYRYNGKLDLPTDEEYIGVIAQEIQEVAPYTVEPLEVSEEDAKGENYLAFDGTALTYVLINAVQEQQAIIQAQQEEIDGLKAELTEVENLKAQMDALAKMVADLKADAAVLDEAVNSDEE